jgi:alkanesulfonate monooxygenase SsuD/methylene tetrahydromethanopterin reductase-like flavin-dependent oxidoreductase (luciferase family)
VAKIYRNQKNILTKSEMMMIIVHRLQKRALIRKPGTSSQKGGCQMEDERKPNPVFNQNRLKLGTFGTNGRGSALTTAPDRYVMTWRNTLNAALAADRLGFEVLLAYARWKGASHGNIAHPSGVILDPFTWAAGLAQATSQIGVLATIHAPSMHPIVAAKQSATVDLISGGRFGLNLVGGWNKDEFGMFGHTLADHDARYDQLEEWLQVLEMLWTAKEEFDFEGRFFKLKGAMSMPQPIQRPRPAIMNAGASGRGQQFACKHADMCFVHVNTDKAKAKREIKSYKHVAREEYGREVTCWNIVVVTQRETRAEAQDYFNYFAVEHADKVAVDYWYNSTKAQTRGLDGQAIADDNLRLVIAAGGWPTVGTARDIADQLEELSEIGIDGLLLGFNNYDDGLQRFGEVMPLLEARGLRKPFQPAAPARAAGIGAGG